MSVTQWFNARREKPQAVGKYEYHRQHDNADFAVEWDCVTFKFADGEYRGLEVYVSEGDTWRGVASDAPDFKQLYKDIENSISDKPAKKATKKPFKEAKDNG